MPTHNDGKGGFVTSVIPVPTEDDKEKKRKESQARLVASLNKTIEESKASHNKATT